MKRFILLALLSTFSAWAWGESVPVLRLDTPQHHAPIRRIAVDATEQWLLTAGDDKTARIWQLPAGNPVGVLRVPVGTGFEGRLYALTISPDGKTIAIAGDTGAANGPMRVWFFDRASTRLIRTTLLGPGEIKQLRYSPDGQTLAACSASTPTLWLISAQGKVLTNQLLQGNCYGMDFSPQGWLAISEFNRKLSIWHWRNGELKPLAETRDLAGDLPVSVAFSPDGQKLALGYVDIQAPVDIWDSSQLSNGQLKLLQRFKNNDLPFGALSNVAWSSNGQNLAAAGSAYRKEPNYVLRRWDIANGRATDVVINSNTVTALRALPDGSLLFAGFNGRWGRAFSDERIETQPLAIADLRGADNLQIANDGLAVQWTYQYGEQTAWFNLHERIIRMGRAPKSLQSASTRGFSQWENHRQPEFAGKPIALAPGESSRSAARLGEDGLLGADFFIRRLDTSGKVSWQIPSGGEARAIVPTADNKRFVSAHSDGTLRWYQASNGQLLLSLFLHPDGIRWVMWTPQGYYDASPGSDQLLGWQINRGPDRQPDFFPVGKFRKTYHRPDVIDEYLNGWDIDLAIKAANSAILAEQLSPPKPAPLSISQILPPVVELMSPGEITTAADQLAIEVVVRSPADAKAQVLKVRVNGVESDIKNQIDASKLANGQPMRISFPLPAQAASVTIVSGSPNGFSPVALLRVNRPPLPQPAPTVSLTPAPAATPIPMPSKLPVPLAATPAPTPSKIINPPTITPVPSKVIAPAPAIPTPTKVAIAMPAPVPSKISTASPAPVVLKPPPPGKPKLFVLAVGVSKYANPDYDLGLAEKDARDFSRSMEAQRKGSLYGEVSTLLLTDSKATRSQILEGLKWLQSNVSNKDTAVLFLAGHGVTRKDRRYFFLPHDVDTKRLDETAVANEQFTEFIAQTKGQRIFFIDTCHAGNALGGRRFSHDIGQIVNDLSSDENGVVVFSSSTGKQLSQENRDWGNGAFTKILVQGINGAADFRKTGWVTQKGLDFYLSSEVPQLTKGEQTPFTIIPFGIPDFPITERIKGVSK
ncbi:caspase family protein [Iodobacter arcticus]|uniref:Caspase family protein n=1 Tax=Iodobacter arcticus TaxID=590593 RepID=A0ABW2QS76_9NEIS